MRDICRHTWQLAQLSVLDPAPALLPERVSLLAPRCVVHVPVPGSSSQDALHSSGHSFPVQSVRGAAILFQGCCDAAVTSRNALSQGAHLEWVACVLVSALAFRMPCTAVGIACKSTPSQGLLFPPKAGVMLQCQVTVESVGVHMLGIW